MSVHMESQVVRPAEGSVAQLAVELLVPGVGPSVSTQHVRAFESPVTVPPTADVGLLPGVATLVGLAVNTLTKCSTGENL